MTFHGVAIKGLSAAVPARVFDNYTMQSAILSEQEIKNAVKTTGIRYRRIAEEGVCASDLCYKAADKLLHEMEIDRASIDVLIFLSQTPDYRQPATAPILQHRLGLGKNTASFDMNLACSGYVYGLSTAFAYCSQSNVNRVLFLVGETLSKVISFEDRATSLLFGDGATATLIEKGSSSEETHFSLNSDGSGFNVLKIEYGGYRNPSSSKTTENIRFEDGSKRNMEQLFMDGMEVFNFTMREVPKDILRVMQYAKITTEDIDFFLLHQANKLITDFFLKKLKVPVDKAPYSIANYGNTSAVSIPLTMVSELKKDLEARNLKLVLSGFGGGLSWASAVIRTNNVHVSDIVEV